VETVEEKKFEIVRRATEAFRRQGHRIIDVDGVRVTFPDGWGLIRASNTQPLLVLRFEAKTRERLDEIRKLIETTLETVKREVGA
jgi:phosphomannomutase/phosphoglucomutase